MKDTLQQAPLNVLLIGDSCTDEYVYGDCNRLSPEAPIPVFDYKYETATGGMVCNVYRNLVALGCEVQLSTGDPKSSVKRRFIDIKSRQQVLRVDTFSDADYWSPSYSSSIGYDALVISDYDKGFIKDDDIEVLKERFKDIPIVVDSKRKDLSVYGGCVLKINEYEYERSQPRLEEYEAVIVTKGSESVDLYCKGFHVSYDVPDVDVFDVTGAGDVFLAALSYYMIRDKQSNSDLAFPIGGAIEKAACLSSVSVAHRGTYTLSKKDIENVNIRF